jgi:serine/threonine protein kinase/formylglycine-generating enzyme required for sulfatase activity
MAAHPIAHPTDRILQAYGLGQLDDVSTESVEAHLESCPDCRKLVAAITPDTFLGRLRDAKVRPDPSRPVVSDTDGPSVLDAGPPPPGLADHPDYEILQELGQGGMGVVFLARNTLMGRLEVLKVVGGHLVNRRGVLDRFLGEIRSAAKLHHPNIVTAYAALRLGESLVLAMEYVEGLDLSKLVKAKGPLPVAYACYYVHQAALGLQHAHERGMVHRDIKPANLILASEGKKALVKVLDFGLARITSEGQASSRLTREGQILGTPDYIAPEQIRDAHSADIRADIYSLGCTLYYLLTGRPPFTGENLWDVYQAHFSMDAPPLNLVRPEVPVNLAALVAKMMAKEPERRFQTPGEVALALTPFFKKGHVTPRTPEAPAPERIATVPEPAPAAPASAPTRLATEAPAPVVRSVKKALPGDPDVRWETLIDLEEAGPSPVVAKPEPEVAPVSAPVRRPPWVWASVAAGLLAVGLLAAWLGGAFGDKTPRPSPRPEASSSVSRRITDGKLVVTTNNENVLNQAGAHFLLQVRSDIKATLIGGKVYINEAYGRRDVLCTESLSRTSPATIDFGGITKDGTGRLILVVHGYPGHLSQRIVVKANGSTVRDTTVRLADGWKKIEVPFSRTRVVLEHHAEGLSMEYLFVDYEVSFDPAPGALPGAGGGWRAGAPENRPATAANPLRTPAKPVAPGRPITAHPFLVTTNGLAGRPFIDPVTFGPDGSGLNPPVAAVPWAAEEAFARLTTRELLAYPPLPVSRFVCELEVTVHKRGRMRVGFGGPYNEPQVGLLWDTKRDMVECSLTHWTHGTWWFPGEGVRHLAPDRRVGLKLAVGDGVQTLFLDGSRILSAGCWPTDCSLRISSETPDSAVIHRCSLRPLTEQDAAACGWTIPPTDLAVTLALEAARRARVAEAFGGADRQPAETYDAAARLAAISRGYPAQPKPGGRFAVKTTGTPMVWIPPGDFEMGSDEPSYEATPRHRVRLTKGYWMAQVEVAQGEYSKLTGTNPSRIKGSPYLPVDWVAWDQAVAYGRKLTDLERKESRLPAGYEYRLPTEAEWEYACRAGSDQDHSGPTSSFWTRENSGPRPHEVAESRPNRWDLYDMQGNAMEWCLDAWRPYPNDRKDVMVDPFEPGRPEQDIFVVRGGAWWTPSHTAASPRRDKNHNYANGFRGFRIVLAPQIAGT